MKPTDYATVLMLCGIFYLLCVCVATMWRMEYILEVIAGILAGGAM